MFGLPSLGAGPMRAFRLPAPAEGQGGIDAADAVAGGGVDDVAGAVAEEQERKAVGVDVGASRCRFGRVGGQPDLRLREGGEHGAQLFVLQHLPCAQEQHQPQSADAAAARQQLVQKMLGRFACLLYTSDAADE